MRGFYFRSLRCCRVYHSQPAQAPTPSSSAPLTSAGSDRACGASPSDCRWSSGGPSLSARVLSRMIAALPALPSPPRSAACRSCCSCRRRGSRSCRLSGCCCSCCAISRCLSASSSSLLLLSLSSSFLRLRSCSRCDIPGLRCSFSGVSVEEVEADDGVADTA